MNLTIRSKVLLGLFLIIFIFILASFLVTLRIDSTKEKIFAVNSLYIPLSRTLSQLKTLDERRGLNGIESFKPVDFQNAFYHFSRFLSLNDHVFMIDSMDRTYRRFTRKHPSLTKYYSKINDQLLVLKNSLKDYNNYSKNASAYIQQKEATIEQAIEKFISKRYEFIRQITLFERFINRRMSMSLLKAENDGSNIVFSLTVFIGIMLFLGILIFFVLSSSLKPLEELTKGVRRLSLGDFTYKILIRESKVMRFLGKVFPPIRSKGEIETLADQFNQMSKSILDRTQELRRSERLATIGKLSSEISHEIRNPLNSISLNLSLLQEELSQKKETQEMFNSISKEVERLSNVTQTYLNYIKPVTVAFSKESLNEIIWNIYDVFKNQLERKGIKCQINLPSEDIVLQLDKNQFKQILINLIKNAVEAFDNSRTRDKKILINLKKENNSLSLQITDNGTGIKKDEIDKIFLPFYTQKENGTGLGLGIAYEIVKKHNGTLTCSSTYGKETTFSIKVPYDENKGA